MQTPFFPAWRPRLAAAGSRLTRVCHHVRAYTLCQLEQSFAPWIPPKLFPKAAAGSNSRDQDYTRWRTFWCMLWQALNPSASGREVVRQLQALFDLENGPQLSHEDGAYCRAKARLPLDQFPQALSATAQFADRLAPALGQLGGRCLKVVDGSTLTLLADTPKNRAAYPARQCQPDPPSFPMVRFVVLFSLLSGTILALAQGSWACSELFLLTQLSAQLAPGDILIGDRGFGYYPLIAWLQARDVDFIGRTTRQIDGRCRRQRLGPKDWLIQWEKGPHASPWMTWAQWTGLPDTLTLRVVKGSLYRKGFRVRQVTLVTTLLDAQAYPLQDILYAYWRRWRLEMCLDDLKTTLGMESLRSRSPDMALKELYLRLIAHNLIRCTMAQAATEHDLALDRISFKGSLDALRHFAQAMAQAKTKKKRQQLWSQLLQTLADDIVPERPLRREPRAVKRKKNRYPRLIGPRGKFRDHLKSNRRRSRARQRKLTLM